MENAIVPSQPQPKIKLVLNRGQQELQSATIAVQWFLSDEAIAEKPTHILIIEQADFEWKDNYDKYDNGRRYLCELTDGVKFLTFRSPGIQHISALLVNEEAGVALTKKAHGDYNVNIDPDFCGVRNCTDIHFHTSEVIKVSQELFAKRPQTGWTRMKWDYVNSHFAEGPADECNFDHREMYAFSLGIPVMLIKFLAIFIARIAQLLVYVIVLICYLIFGYRPKPPFQELLKIVTGRRYWKENVAMYSEARLWKKGTSGNKDTYLPITPDEILFRVGIVAFFIYIALPVIELAKHSSMDNYFFHAMKVIGSYLLAGIFIIAGFESILGLLERWFGFATWLSKSLLEKVTRTVQARKSAMPVVDMAEIRENQRLVWLKSQLSMQALGTGDGQLAIAEPPSKSDRLIQRFKVSYYELKARSCRPFSS